MVKKSTQIAVLTYGLLLIVLGILGYVKAGSAMSLYAGSGSGVILVFCAVLMHYKISFGSYASVFFTLLLTGMFAYRYTVTSKTLPALLAVLSGGMLLYLLAALTKWRRT